LTGFPLALEHWPNSAASHNAILLVTTAFYISKEKLYVERLCKQIPATKTLMAQNNSKNKPVTTTAD
jgi:hypothetical protein